MTPCIDRVRLLSVDAAPGTVWLFVELSLDDGTAGWGEASLNGAEAAVAAVARRLLPELAGTVIATDALFARLPFATLPEAAVSSAVMQAFRDAGARHAGAPLAECLDTRRRDRVGLYANINRRTRDRAPEGMAASARDAQAAGFDAVKIAPFDEVQPGQPRDEMRAAMAPGLARIAAVRDVLGPQARLMVDCHWRFDATGAAEMIDAAAPLAPWWIECPVDEAPENIDVIRGLRARANAVGLRLAGLETRIRAEGFQPYLDAGAYDVMMPDVKYAGGPDEMLRLAALFARHGVAFSPHNPTGPICHAQSLHICAALADSDLLEHQFDETPLFDALVGHALPLPCRGVAAPDWTRPGLGIDLAGDAARLRDVAATGKGAGA